MPASGPILRKLSEESGTCLPVSVTEAKLKMSSGVPTSSCQPLPHKPCLKRRSSVPAAAAVTAVTLLTGHRSHGSCDSFDDSFDCGCSSSYSSAGSSFSRKSVSFADSIGEDLCHIKVFSKDLSELDEANYFQEPWTARMRRWQWQQYYAKSDAANASTGCSSGGELDWYLEEEEEGGDEAFLYQQYDEDFGYADVIVEEDEEEEEEAFSSRVPGDGQDATAVLASAQDVAPADGALPTTYIAAAAAAKVPAVVVVQPTFLSPRDLPDYADRLEESGVLLEEVSVNDENIINGTVRLHERVVAVAKVQTETEEGDLRPRLCRPHHTKVRFSQDNWASFTEVETTSYVFGELYSFVIDAGHMECGDDLELAVICHVLLPPAQEDAEAEAKEQFEDDNKGFKYRFICKNKPKFQPGKSLW